MDALFELDLVQNTGLAAEVILRQYYHTTKNVIPSVDCHFRWRFLYCHCYSIIEQ